MPLRPRVSACAVPALSVLLSACSAGSFAPSQTLAPSARARSAPKGYALLYSFEGAPDGAVPYGGVILGKKGEIFGTTRYGGTSSPPSKGAGTVFELAKSGDGYAETIVHSFGADGYYPSTGPTLDPSGTLYATVQSGSGSGSAGGVVSLTPSDGEFNESGVYRFAAATGSSPASQLIELTDGSDIFYGTLLYTTALGGGASGKGSVVSLTLGLAFTDEYDFQGGGGDGAAPMGNLAIDPLRNVYGATSEGGDGPGKGDGTVFKLNPNTGGETILYKFKGGSADGSAPAGGVVLDNAGNLYGTTQNGGANGRGVVFKLSYNGSGFTETVLHSFGGAGDGATPLAAPVITVSSGILFGTTSAGGSSGGGTLYELSTSGARYKVLYDFAKSSGSSPGYGSLLLSGNALYGTTEAGGGGGQGVVYRFVP